MGGWAPALASIHRADLTLCINLVEGGRELRVWWRAGSSERN